MGYTSGAGLEQAYDKARQRDIEVLNKLKCPHRDGRIDELTRAKIWRACRDNEAFYLFNFVRTRDEHDQDSPIKPLPDKKYLHDLLYHIKSNPLVAIPKSRQMMITWLLVAHASWLAKFHAHRLIFIQSKKEEDAANLVFNQDWVTGRLSLIEFYLPKFLRSVGLKAKYGQLFYPNGSLVWGIPQGAHMLRSYTASCIIMDECCFQDKFEEAYTAALPTIKNGGHLIMCSTAQTGTFFARLIGEDDEAAA